MLLNSKKSLKCKILTLKCFLKMTKLDLVVASTRHHLARLLKYYPRRPCAPSFVKSRILPSLKRHFLLFQQIFFILICIHAGNPRVPPLGQNPAGCKNQMECATTPLSQQAGDREETNKNTYTTSFTVT